jgi:hypothetical protein
VVSLPCNTWGLGLVWQPRYHTNTHTHTHTLQCCHKAVTILCRQCENTATTL